jgi:hypothetical protein
MSRITGSDAKALMEAYASVYAPQQEEVVEEVEQLNEVEDVRALRAKAEAEARQKQLNQSQKEFKAGGGEAALSQARGRRENLSRDEVIKRGRLALKDTKSDDKADNQPSLKAKQDYAKSKGKYYSSSDGKTYANYNDALAARNSRLAASGGAGGSDDSRSGGGSNVISAKNITGQQQKVTVGRQYAATLGGQKGNVTYDASGKRTFTPSSTEGSKVAPAATKPVVKQTGDKAKDMATWASTPANKGLAAAAAEKARIRGTQQTDNPLMKDMKSRLPMNSPSVQSPDVAKLGKGNQSLVSNPNAFKAATPAKAVSAAPSTSPAASGSVAPATAKLAATPKPTPVAPNRATGSKKPGSAFEQYDAYDVVLEYLLDNGHVDTVDEAHYVMMEMDAEMIAAIVEEKIQVNEADSLAAMQARREKRLAAQRKREGTTSTGRDFGRDDRLSAAQQKERRDAEYEAGTKKEEFEAWIDEAMTNYEKNRKRAAQRAAARNEARAQGKTGAVPGVGYVTPRKERETWTDESGKTRHAKGL